MAKSEIDEYLSAVPEPQRSTLETMRTRILEIVPDAEQCLSYGMPGFRVRGKVLAGFAANKNDLSYYPHSGAVLAQFADELAGYPQTKGALHFPNTKPLAKTLLRKLIAAKKAIAFGEEGLVAIWPESRDLDLDYYAERDGIWRELGLSAPARRALVNAGILTIEDLKARNLAEIRHLHGIGPSALKLLGEL
ncbi:MAG: DUF1801 domain-containing protein [Candidatus Nanopelagicales bacterium]